MPMTALSVKVGPDDIRMALRQAGFNDQNFAVHNRYYYLLSEDWVRNMDVRLPIPVVVGGAPNPTCYEQAMLTYAAVMKTNQMVDQAAFGLVSFPLFTDDKGNLTSLAGFPMKNREHENIGHAMNIIVCDGWKILFVDYSSGFRKVYTLEDAVQRGMIPKTARIQI